MIEKTFQLHEVVRDLASKLELQEGRMIMTDAELARSRARLLRVSGDEEKKAVLVSLVAFATRLARESPEGAAQVVVRLADLAAGLIGDVEKARAIFAEAGAAPGLKAAKPKGKGPKKRR